MAAGRAHDKAGPFGGGDGDAQTSTVEDLLAAVEKLSVGDEVVLLVDRNGQQTKLRCRLQEQQQQQQQRRR